MLLPFLSKLTHFLHNLLVWNGLTESNLLQTPLNALDEKKPFDKIIDLKFFRQLVEDGTYFLFSHGLFV